LFQSEPASQTGIRLVYKLTDKQGLASSLSKGGWGWIRIRVPYISMFVSGLSWLVKVTARKIFFQKL